MLASMKPITGSPIDRVLTIALILAPAVGLLSTVLYAARGWDDAARPGTRSRRPRWSTAPSSRLWARERGERRESLANPQSH
jgi:hypothetical protein